MAGRVRKGARCCTWIKERDFFMLKDAMIQNSAIASDVRKYFDSWK